MKDKIRLLIFITCILITVGIGIKVLLILSDYKANDKLYEGAVAEYIKIPTEKPIVPKVSETDTVSEPQWYDAISVDFNNIRKASKDCIGWLYFEDVDINYPIVYSGDNDTYLRRSYTGEASTAGSIFLDGRNNPDLEDSNIIIYGHNMKNGSMFAPLKNYLRDKDYASEHQFFQIHKDGKTYRYAIAAALQVDQSDKIYEIFPNGGDAYNNYLIDSIVNRSKISTDSKISVNNKIAILSTCSSGDNRLIVCGVRVDEHRE